MNTKIIFAAAGGIAAVAIIMFLTLGSFSLGQFERPKEVKVIQPTIAVTDVLVTKVDDENANVQITFAVDNPNPATVMLESIHYFVAVDGHQIITGDVGATTEGFLSSQGDLFPIVAGTTLTVKDKIPIVRTVQTADAWDKIVGGEAKYDITGNFAYRLTASLNTTAEEPDFALTFP